MADPIEYVVRIESARRGDNARRTPYTRLDWVRTRDQLLGKASGSSYDNYFPRRTEIVLNQLSDVFSSKPKIDDEFFKSCAASILPLLACSDK